MREVLERRNTPDDNADIWHATVNLIISKRSYWLSAALPNLNGINTDEIYNQRAPNVGSWKEQPIQFSNDWPGNAGVYIGSRSRWLLTPSLSFLAIMALILISATFMPGLSSLTLHSFVLISAMPVLITNSLASTLTSICMLLSGLATILELAVIFLSPSQASSQPGELKSSYLSFDFRNLLPHKLCGS